MTTTMKDLRFGMEIETVGLTCEQLARAIHTVVQGSLEGSAFSRTWYVTQPDGRRWKVEPDGSLSGGHLSGEIVSPILSYSDIELLQNIVRAVRKAGARADESTGIHIHIGADQFDAKSLTNLVKFVYKQERLLEHVFAAHAGRVYYCQAIDEGFLARLEALRPKTLEALSDAWYGGPAPRSERRHSSRYRGLNLHSFFYRRTLEFRYFNATLHAGEVKANLQLVLAMAANALQAKAASSKRREFNQATAKYDFRVVLLRLGLIGDEFKTARFHLLKRLAGSAAWKGGRRDRPTAPSMAVANVEAENHPAM